MKKLYLTILSVLTILACVACANRNAVIVYTSLEDFRLKDLKNLLSEELPEVDVKFQYYSSGTHAAKLKFEGKKTVADIFLALESAYADNVSDNFYNLSNYSTSRYLDDILPKANKFHVFSRESGCIAVNTKRLKELNLEVPKSYEDLLKPEYREEILMPNPKSSGTGYVFYNNVVALRGEEGALDYFSRLSRNIKFYTESGSAPVNALKKGDVSIALCMAAQAANTAKVDSNIKLYALDTGLPYTIYTMGIIEGHQKRAHVQDVYDVLFNKAVENDNIKFCNEQIYKDLIITNPYYPEDYKFSQMVNVYDYKYKEHLLDQWRY